MSVKNIFEEDLKWLYDHAESGKIYEIYNRVEKGTPRSERLVVATELLLYRAIERFNKQTGCHNIIMIWLTSVITVLTLSMLIVALKSLGLF